MVRPFRNRPPAYLVEIIVKLLIENQFKASIWLCRWLSKRPNYKAEQENKVDQEQDIR